MESFPVQIAIRSMFDKFNSLISVFNDGSVHSSFWFVIYNDKANVAFGDLRSLRTLDTVTIESLPPKKRNIIDNKGQIFIFNKENMRRR